MRGSAVQRALECKGLSSAKGFGVKEVDSSGVQRAGFGVQSLLECRVRKILEGFGVRVLVMECKGSQISLILILGPKKI